MGGRARLAVPLAAEATRDPPLERARGGRPGLVCQFGAVRAVDDLSFEVAEGEVFGLLGPNGAGKTTVIRVVTTLLKPAAGTMQAFGLDTGRLELAQAVVSRPRLLVLDEPSIGLDPPARASLWERVLGLRAELHMTVLLTTHYMEEAERLCDRVGLLLDGHLRAIGRPREPEAMLGPGATLEDVFRAYAADGADEDRGGLRDVHWQPPRLLGAAAAVMLGSAFFASNALYPTALMPAWVRAITRVNPLSYEVNALRQLLLGLPGSLAADFAALLGATVAGIAAASLLLGRLAR